MTLVKVSLEKLESSAFFSKKAHYVLKAIFENKILFFELTSNSPRLYKTFPHFKNFNFEHFSILGNKLILNPKIEKTQYMIYKGCISSGNEDIIISNPYNESNFNTINSFYAQKKTG